jgi:hypothetical protein
MLAPVLCCHTAGSDEYRCRRAARITFGPRSNGDLQIDHLQIRTAANAPIFKL